MHRGDAKKENRQTSFMLEDCTEMESKNIHVFAHHVHTITHTFIT